MTWIIRQSALAEMAAHARDERPRECCGLLLGVAGTVLVARRSTNLSPDPNRFLIDPAVHIDARREARTHGHRIVGFYHSHPHSPPIPSATDLAEAWYSDHVYTIVGWRGEAVETRFYELRSGQFVELPVTVVA